MLCTFNRIFYINEDLNCQSLIDVTNLSVIFTVAKSKYKYRIIKSFMLKNVAMREKSRETMSEIITSFSDNYRAGFTKDIRNKN